MNYIWHLCYANMKQRGVRTILTVLGVVIGVISIVSLLAIGIGVKNTMIEQLDTNEAAAKIILYNNENTKKKNQLLTNRKIDELRDMEHIESVYPCLTAPLSLSYENYDIWVNLIGVPKEYLEHLHPQYLALAKKNAIKPQVLVGKSALYGFYNDVMQNSYMDKLEEEEKKNVDLSGEKLKVKISDDWQEQGVKWDIVGMVDKDDYNMYCDIDLLKRYLKGVSTDGTILGQPKDANDQAYTEWIYNEAIIYVDAPENVEKIIKKLNNLGYNTENEKEYIDSMQKLIKIIQIMLGCIGMIALVVAVIGIGNTMTTSVYDRINEIGILKVLGCDPDELRFLFLLEAGILGGIGGVIGVLASLGITRFGVNYLLVKMLRMENGIQLACIPTWLAAFAIIFAIVLGIAAGYFPARWAVKLKPIDAVRHS